MPPKACGIITAQLIYKLQVLFKQQDMRKNEKYCLVLVQICVPIFSLSLSRVFTEELFSCDFNMLLLRGAFCFLLWASQPPAAMSHLPPNPEYDHQHQNMTISSKNDTPCLKHALKLSTRGRERKAGLSPLPQLPQKPVSRSSCQASILRQKPTPAAS